MTKVGHVELASAVLCEDIRMEKSDKLILIGVFGGNIFVEDIPATLALALYLPGVAPEPGKSELYLRYSGPGRGSAIFTAELETTTKNESVGITIPRITVSMEREGTFKIDISDDQKRWKRLIRKRIDLKKGLWSLGRPTA